MGRKKNQWFCDKSVKNGIAKGKPALTPNGKKTRLEWANTIVRCG